MLARVINTLWSVGLKVNPPNILEKNRSLIGQNFSQRVFNSERNGVGLVAIDERARACHHFEVVVHEAVHLLLLVFLEAKNGISGPTLQNKSCSK